MNDPGLDSPIAEDAKDVENQKRDEKEEQDEDEAAFLEPRWASPDLLTRILPRHRNQTNPPSHTRNWLFQVAGG